MKSNPHDEGRPEGLRYERQPQGRRDGSGGLPPELAEALDRARPRLGALASKLLYFETIGSTNDEAVKQSSVAGRQSSIVSRQSSVAGRPSAAALSLPVPSPQPPARSPQPPVSPRDPEGLVVVADAQTAGRGRRGHTWFSPPGSGLYASVVLVPSRARVDPERATTLLTLAAGVGLAEGIEAATGLRVDLKWPNDLQVARRKLAGILAEASGAGDAASVIVGYGINVAATAFPPELRDRATSLESELGRAVDRHHVLVETLASLARRYEDLLDGRFDAILDAWRRLAPAASGARVEWTTNAATSSGVTAGIDERGALLVRIDDRVERIISGEVNWL